MIKVNLMGVEPSSKRIQVCNEVRRLTPEEARLRFYRSNSILFTGEWHDIESSNHVYLLQNEDKNYFPSVTILKLRDEAEQATIQTSNILRKRGLYDRSEDILQSQVSVLVDYIARSLGLDSRNILVGIHLDKPGLDTVTIDTNTGHFIGLHVDSWSEKIGRGDRHNHIRVAINIGSVPRYFVFCPEFYIERPGKDVNELLEAFEVAVAAGLVQTVRVRVDPGEAYIANTDIMIHDASTELVGQEGASLQIRGQMLVSFQSTETLNATLAN